MHRGSFWTCGFLKAVFIICLSSSSITVQKCPSDAFESMNVCNSMYLSLLLYLASCTVHFYPVSVLSVLMSFLVSQIGQFLPCVGIHKHFVGVDIPGFDLPNRLAGIHNLVFNKYKLFRFNNCSCFKIRTLVIDLAVRLADIKATRAAFILLV